MKHLLISLIVVCLVYSLSLTREWQFFDERILYNEAIFPRPGSFSELLEIISTYAFTYHTDSQNAFFSNIVNIRSNILGAILNILVLFFFNKNAFLYHMLELCLHLLNTSLVWFILFFVISPKNTFQYLITSLITLIWSLHPVNIEAVLLGTNWTSLVTYSFCFGFFLYTLIKIKRESYTCSKKETIYLALLFCLSLLISEYGYAMPLIIFVISFAFSRSLGTSFRLCFPYVIGIIIFAGIYTIKNTPALGLSFERILWLSPQILAHILRLIFYPKELSLYQTNLSRFADSLFDPFAIFSFFLLSAFIFLPLLLFKRSLFLLPYCFVFSLIPFLQIFSPTYCLIAERYCYFPLFCLLFALTVLLKEFMPHFTGKKVLTCIILTAILFSSTARTIYRINDWKDSLTLYQSNIKYNGSNLYKGETFSVLAYYLKSINKDSEAIKYAKVSIKHLLLELQRLKTKKTESKVLKSYGLDSKSLLITSAFAIASSRFDYLKEDAKEVLNFYEPFIKDDLNFAGSSQLNLYAKLLLQTQQEEKAKEVLEFANKKYPLNPIIIYPLSNMYLNNKDINKAKELIQTGYNCYPSYPRMLIRMIKLSELTNDRQALAKYEYLLGLRAHSLLAYKRAIQIYLLLNNTNEAKKVLDKLIYLSKKPGNNND